MTAKVLNSDSGTFSHLCAWRKEEHGILAATPKSGELFETSLFAFLLTEKKKKKTLHQNAFLKTKKPEE